VSVRIVRLRNSVNDGEVTGNAGVSVTSYVDTGLRDGYYEYRIVGADEYGNESRASESIEVEIDGTAPMNAMNFEITTEDASVTLNWEIEEDVERVQVLMSRNGYPTTTANGSIVTDNVRGRAIGLNEMEDGRYYFSVILADKFGNRSGVVTASVEIDARPTVEKLKDLSEVKKGILELNEDITVPVESPKIGKNASTATLDINARYVASGTELGVGDGSVGNIVIATENGTWVDGADVKIGAGGGVGNVYQSGGRVDITGALALGSDSTSSGNYVLSGGILKTQKLVIGQNGGSGTFEWAGGTLETRSVEGDLTNKSGIFQVRSDGPVRVTGNYTQLGTGRIEFTLTSTNVGLVTAGETMAGVTPLLQSTGTLNLSGRVVVSISGYNPKPGQKILLVKRSGAQVGSGGMKKISSGVTLELPELDGRLSWDTSEFETAGVIGIVGSSSTLIPNRPLNFPNPFKLRTGTSIGYWMNADSDIELRIYTATGMEVFRKAMTGGVDQGGLSGYNKITINQDVIGSDLPSGVYPYVLINKSKVVGKGRLVIRPN